MCKCTEENLISCGFLRPKREHVNTTMSKQSINSVSWYKKLWNKWEKIFCFEFPMKDLLHVTQKA